MKRSLAFLSLLVVLIIALPLAVFLFLRAQQIRQYAVEGTVYYVDNSNTGCSGAPCSNANTGTTPNTAWRTISHDDQPCAEHVVPSASR